MSTWAFGKSKVCFEDCGEGGWDWRPGTDLDSSQESPKIFSISDFFSLSRTPFLQRKRNDCTGL